MRDNGINSTAHGWRSCFRSWCSDTGVPRDLAEAALGHAVRDRTERAYARSDVLERRIALMQAWAQYIDSLTRRPLPAPPAEGSSSCELRAVAAA